MDSRLNIQLLKFACMGLMSLMMVSCQDTIPARSTITPDSSLVNPTPTCPSGQIPSTTTSTNGTPGTTTCVDAPPSRPADSVKFRPGFCGCKEKKPTTFGNCSSFCSTKSTNGAGLFYASFNVSESISLDSTLQSVAGWCNKPLPDDKANPKCVLLARDEDNNETLLDVEVGGTPNSVIANIDKLIEDKIYVLTLYETSAKLKSDSIQIIKYSAEIPIATLGPLKNAPITQYACLNRPPIMQNNDTYFDSAFKVHFYFIPRIPPNPIPPGTDYVCHDFMNHLYGAIDDISYPRLDQIPGIFNLWDNTDPRFYDNNSNNIDDITEIIIQKAKNFGAGAMSNSLKFFMQLPTFELQAANTTNNNTTNTTTTTPSSSAQTMGYYMSPWIDQSNSRSYCLNNSHYSGSNPLFRALGEVIGVDTEGFYMASKVPQYVQDPNGQTLTAPNDCLMIRETDLKKAWFYFKNNVPTVPTEAMVSNVAIFFYYPINPASPYVRASTQSLYQVKSIDELKAGNVCISGGTTQTTTATMPTHDKKIGCIPKF